MLNLALMLKSFFLLAEFINRSLVDKGFGTLVDSKAWRAVNGRHVDGRLRFQTTRLLWWIIDVIGSNFVSAIYLFLLPLSYSKLLSAAAWSPPLLSWGVAFASTKSMGNEGTHETKSNTGAYDEAGEHGKRHSIYMFLRISLEVREALWRIRVWEKK